jgi:hypothetical protein
LTFPEPGARAYGSAYSASHLQSIVTSAIAGSGSAESRAHTPGQLPGAGARAGGFVARARGSPGHWLQLLIFSINASGLSPTGVMFKQVTPASL